MHDNEKETIFYKMGFQEEDRFLLRWGMVYTFLIGFFAHGFLLQHLSLSHDALFYFYDYDELSTPLYIGLGRFLEPVYRKMTASGLLMPWSLGLTAFFWLGLAVFLVCKLLHLSGKMEVFLAAGIMTANISVTAIAAGYTPWLAVYMFALLLAITNVYCWQIYERGHQKKWLLFGVLALCCSLSIYQSYIEVTVVLMILVSIQRIMENDSVDRVFWDGMAGIGMIAAGGFLYYFLLKAVTGLTDTPLVPGYSNSVTNLWENQEPVLWRAIFCIKEELTHFFAKDENIYPYPVIWIVNVCILLVCLYLIVCLVKQKKAEEGGVEKWLLLALLTVALPFAAYMMRLLNTSVHDIMVYSVWLLYLIPILLWKWTDKEGGANRKIYCCIVALLVFIIFAYSQTDNAIYVKKEAEAKATLALMTEIMTQIDQTEGYIPGETAVTFVGEVTGILHEVPGTEGIKGVSGCNRSAAITYEGTYQAYFKNVMLRDVKVVFDKALKENSVVEQMPAYPQQGYVKLLDGVVVVKLENVE